MTPRYPGAVWMPTGDNGAMPNGPDAGSMHEAVTRSRSVYGWVQEAKSCQAYIGPHGYTEQYMDWDRIAYGVKNGNGHVLTVESFDGLLIHNDPNYWEEGMGGVYGTDSNSGRWDDGQCERWSDLIAWCAVNLGIQLVQSMEAGSPGWGPHRLGVEPWRSDQYGHGESWTNHDGKPCPGDLRIAQIPGIIARAKVIRLAVEAGRCTWLPQGDVDLGAALARTGGGTTPVKPSTPTDWFSMATRADLDAAIAAAIPAIAAAVLAAPVGPHAQTDNTTGKETNLRGQSLSACIAGIATQTNRMRYSTILNSRTLSGLGRAVVGMVRK